MKGTNGSAGLGGLVLDEGDLKGSLLLPLINSLSHAFEVPMPLQRMILTGKPVTNNPVSADPETVSRVYGTLSSTPSLIGGDSGPNNSLQNLKQAIMERDEAERLEKISSTSPVPDGPDYSFLINEIKDLHLALAKLVSVIRVIVIHCDRRVSNVASNILQVSF